jgi:PIN domain nuclease of toxin-antitoxin system
MRVLLDTHLVIWSLAYPARLSSDARNLIEQAQTIFVSSASIWEMSIKSALGKLDIDLDRTLVELKGLGVVELPVNWQHAQQVKLLPRHHRDPFDHLLIAQAISEPLILLTHDRVLSQYSGLVRVV